MVPGRLGHGQGRLAHVQGRPAASADAHRPRFTPREPPDGDVATYLANQLSTRTWPYQATVTLPEPADAVADRVWPGMGVVEAVDATSCLVHLGADTPWSLAWMITSIDADFTLTSGPRELVDALRTQGDRCLSAIAGS